MLPLTCSLPDGQLLAVDEALDALASTDARAAEIVKLRFFAGLTEPEIAGHLGISLSTVRRNKEERAAFIAAECGDDHHLRQQVEDLLESNEQGDIDSFLLQPVALPGDESPGAVDGRYRLLKEIGAGTFGRVFRAEQTEPMHRLVAIKDIKAGMEEIYAELRSLDLNSPGLDHEKSLKVKGLKVWEEKCDPAAGGKSRSARILPLAFSPACGRIPP